MKISDNSSHQRPNLLYWMVNNHVAANLLMLALIIGGLIGATRITQEVFPAYDLDIVDISIRYPGASPEEVERGVVLALEEEIRSIEDVERVTAVAEESSAKITAELLTGADPDRVLQEIKSNIDRINTLPDDAEKPQISLKTRRRGVVRLALYGDLSERTLFELASTVKEEMISLAEVTQVELRGIREPELSIEIPQQTLRAYGLTLGQVANAVREKAVDVPAGTIKAKGGEVLLRTKDRRNVPSEFGAIALISETDGTKVRLDDIAQIRDGYAETDREAYYNGKRAVILYIYRTGDQTPQQISKAVHGYVNRLQPTLPESVQLVVYRDRSELYQQRLDLLLKNGGLGLALVLLTLGLFLEPRLAFWVSMGIPISIIGSLVILTLIDGSINMISLFGFIITLGIVVDDAIVVGENIYYKRQAGLPVIQAAYEGVKEMAPPVSIAVMTNIIAFLPLLFITGSTGRFFAILPAVVICVFLISLVECLLVLPAHLTYKRQTNTGILELLGRIPRYFGTKLAHFIENIFTPLVRFHIKNRYMVAILSISVLIVSYGYWDSGWIDFSFRPRIQTDSIDAEIELPFGSTIEDVRKVAKQVEEGGLRAIDNNGGRKILVGVKTDIGRRGSNTAEVTFTLVPQGERKITTGKFSAAWRKEVGKIPGLEKLFFDFLVGPGGSAAVNVELTHPDPKTLELAAADLAKTLANYKGITDINDGFARGKPQLDFSMHPMGSSLGLSAKELGNQVRHAFYGAESIRQQRGRDELKIVVRLPESERQSLYHVEHLLIRTPLGGEIPLSSAAQVKRSRAYTKINRVDGKRVLNVTANIIPGQANANKILASLRAEPLPKLLGKYTGLKFSFEGREREKRKAVRDLFYGLALILPAIFCLLAILFRSYFEALFVMLAIPFGLVSALVGHIIMGYDLSIISVFGMIALCGVVINGGLVFMVTANRYTKTGKSPTEGAVRAAARRFRPIILTALTTFFGLAPMIFEQSVQARFLVPMAISLGYGILFTTVVILFLMPSLYVIYHDIHSLGRKNKDTVYNS